MDRLLFWLLPVFMDESVLKELTIRRESKGAGKRQVALSRQVGFPKTPTAVVGRQSGTLVTSRYHSQSSLKQPEA